MKNLILTIIAILLTFNVAQADWTEKFSLKGDVRLRTEGIQDEDKKDRWRQRIRARLNIKADVNEDIKAILRVASGAGTGDVTSTNSTNDNFGANKPFNLDLAYVSWKISDQLYFEGGKLKNALYRVGGSDILWDSDWTPEGGQIIYVNQMDGMKVFSNVVGYFLDESSASQETSVLGAQVGLMFGEGVKFTLGGGYYAMNTQGFNALDDNGNSLDLGGNYVNDYKVAEAFAMATFDVMDMPLSIYTNYANNTEADIERDAFLVGAQIGKTKEIGDFKIDVAYRKIKKDAVLGILNDGDFNNGNTDGEGLTTTIEYKFAKNSVMGIKYLTSDQGVSTNADTKYDRYQLDFAFKF